jgi:hypothetical protein
VEYYGQTDEPQQDHVSFTAVFDGIPPVVVEARSVPNDGTTSRLFDALQVDLIKHA